MATSANTDVVETSEGAGDITVATGSVQVVVRYQPESQVSVLQGNSNLTIDRERQEYVFTPDLDTADKILQREGFVILCGPPGSGKTTLANALSRRSRQQGFCPYTLDSLERWTSNVGQQQQRSVVVLDGVFGHVLVHSQQLNCWRVILNTVLEQIKGGMCRLVITVYPHVLRELQRRENRLSSPFRDLTAVVSLIYDMPTKARKELLDFHLNRVPGEIDADPKNQIMTDILDKDVSGPVFPWCCGYMVEHWTNSKDPAAIFSTPAEAYTELLKDMFLDKSQGGVFAAVLALAMRGVSLFLHNPSQASPHLKELGFEAFSDDTLEAYADDLKGFILSGTTFCSRVLYEATGLAMGRHFRLATLLKVCDVPFLVKYVHLSVEERLMPDGPPFNVFVTVGSVPICSANREESVKNVQALVQRIYTDIIQGDLQRICQHPCLQCPQFLQELDNYCAKDPQRIIQLLNAVDSVHKLPLLYWSVFLPSDVLSCWCLSKMQTNTQLPMLSVMARSLFDSAAPKSDVRCQAFVHQMTTPEHVKQLQHVMDFPLLKTDQCLTKEVGQHVESITKMKSGPGRLLYLCDPSLPISPEIVRLQRTDDKWQLQVKNRGDWYLVLRLLSDREVSETDSDGNSLLHLAISCGQYTAVTLCLKAGAGITQCNRQGVTPYQLAHTSREWLPKDRTRHQDMGTVTSRFGKMDKADVQLHLLESGGVKAKDSEGLTGLHVACHKGWRDLVGLYIELGADVTAATRDGDTALHFACRCESHTDSADITRLLLQAGADVNTQDQCDDTPLLYATKNGHADIAELLIRHGADVNTQNKDGDTPLLYAAMNGHADTAELLIHHGADVTIQNVSGDTPLLHVAKNCHSNIAELLKSHGADVTIQNKHGDTPLLYAAKNGHSDTAKLLILHGADVTIQNKNGDTPLLYAAMKGHSDTAELLIQHGADVNTQDKNGDTPLLYAAMKGHSDTAELLIRHGADVNTQNEDGDTPLLYAALDSHSDTAELLIRHGADVNTQNKDGDTPLLCAARHGYSDTSKLLIHHGADVNIQNKDGDTPLLWAVSKGLYNIVDLLLRHGADVKIQNKNDNTSLLWAVRKGLSDIVDLLLRHGADVNFYNCVHNHKTIACAGDIPTDPCTALHWACENGMVQTVKLLIQHQADVNTTTQTGLTALHFACLCKSHTDSADITCLLLQAGADVDTQNKDGNTPLLHAAREGHSDTAELLIRYGADVNTQNKDGDTPLLCVAMKGHSDTAQLLIRHGADVNVRNKQDDTPLGMAKSLRNKDLTGLLKRHGAKE